MSKKPLNFSKTIIYKIVCRDLDTKDLYVGHTINWKDRKSKHKKSCNNIRDKRHNCKVYEFIRDNGGWDNWCMIEIEKYPCNDVNEARSRERHWIELLDARLNTNMPNRNIIEWRQINREKLLKDKRNDWNQNKDIYNEKRRTEKYTCECGSFIRKADKSEHEKSKKHIQFISSPLDLKCKVYYDTS